MRYVVDVKSDKEKEFLQMMKALQSLRVVKACKQMEASAKKKKKRTAASLKEGKKDDVSSRDMANQYRDLVD